VDPVKIALIYTDIPTATMEQTPVLIGGNLRAAGATDLLAGAVRARPHHDRSFIWFSRPIDAGFFLYELLRVRWAAGKHPIAVAAFGPNG
jgi:hypothetical protein